MRILWLIVEDKAAGNSDKLKKFRDERSGDGFLVEIELLNAETPKATNHRGVSQRNRALDYLESLSEKNESAAVYRGSKLRFAFSKIGGNF